MKIGERNCASQPRDIENRALSGGCTEPSSITVCAVTLNSEFSSDDWKMFVSEGRDVDSVLRHMENDKNLGRCITAVHNRTSRDESDHLCIAWTRAAVTCHHY